MYNDFMDELEYAASCGFDAVCVNEHHSNGYGLMPSPNLIASSLARRTTDTAICVMGNSLALYNPPTRVAEEFAMIDVISGGRLIAGFPVGTPMDTCYAYGHQPEPASPALPRGARPGAARLDRARHLRVQRPVQPAALCEYLAAPGAEAASADLDSRRRLGRNMALVRRDGLRLLLPVLLRLQGRPRDDGRILGRNEAARQGTQPLSRRLPAIRRRRRIPPARLRSLRRGGGILLRPLPARRCTLGDAARLYQRGQPARRHRIADQAGRRCQRARQIHRRAFRLRGARDGCDRGQGLRHHRLAPTRWRSNCARSR